MAAPVNVSWLRAAMRYCGWISRLEWTVLKSVMTAISRTAMVAPKPAKKRSVAMGVSRRGLEKPATMAIRMHRMPAQTDVRWLAAETSLSVLLEECDDGNDAAGDGCNAQCQREVCGNGRVEVGAEECDDGNLDPRDACTSGCRLARCGDGITRSLGADRGVR